MSVGMTPRESTGGETDRPGIANLPRENTWRVSSSLHGCAKGTCLANSALHAMSSECLSVIRRPIQARLPLKESTCAGCK
jgi:hypothetical protein